MRQRNKANEEKGDKEMDSRGHTHTYRGLDTLCFEGIRFLPLLLRLRGERKGEEGGIGTGRDQLARPGRGESRGERGREKEVK